MMASRTLFLMALALSSVACAGEKQPARKGPLAGLPSKPGPHIARIKAMGDNTWLELGKPKPDPKYGPAPGRSYTNKMAYAAGLGGAFLYGEGVHGKAMMRGGKLHYNDDLFFYDVNAHAWVCAYPGTDIKNVTMKLDKNGFEVAPDGQHLPIAILVHGYEMTEYIPDIGKFMAVRSPSVYWKHHLLERRRAWGGAAEYREGSKGERGRGKDPYLYDVKTGRWERRKTTGRGPQIGHGMSMIHLPRQMKILMYKRTSDVWLFDYRLNAWEHVKGKANGLSFSQWSEGASCYDPKRERLYAFNENGSSGIYDVKTSTWMKFGEGVQPNRLAKTKYMSTRASAHYDVANDVVVVRIGNKFWVYEPARNKWVSEKPVTVHASGNHSFYDPKLNAHFFYHAGDSNFKPGVIRAWRYKKTGRRK